MARAGNPFYYGADENLGAALGQSLGTALFGNPEMAAQLALRKAQTDYMAAQSEEARAHAGLYGKQGEGVGIQNDASRNLPALIASMFAPPAPAAPAAVPAAPADPLAPLPAASPGGYYPTPTEAMSVGLPAVVAAMAQMQGDKVDPRQVMGTLGAFMGDEEMVRRGMAAQGQSPSKEFAITPERADDIRTQEFNKDRDVATINHAQDVAVANANHATDIPVAHIKAGADRDVATINGKTDLDVAEIKGTGDYDRAGAIKLGNTLGRVTSTVRTPEHNKEVGGVSNSYHLAARGGRAIDIARAPGVSHAQVVAKFKAAGYTVIESLDEGDHTHLALDGGPSGGKSKADAKPAQLSKADVDMVDKELKTQLEQSGLPVSERARTTMKTAALARFQKGGNPALAVKQTIDGVRANLAKQQGKKPAETAAKPAAKPDLRQEALAAIAKGAPAATVRQRYKRMTGQNL